MEDEAAWKIREVEMQTTAFLEEQRLNILKEAAYELGMKENKAANAAQNLEQQLHEQYVELSSRSFDFENSQGSQPRPFAELLGREEVLQAALPSTKQEVQNFRSAGWSAADLREEINADAITRKENRDDLEEKLCISQSCKDYFVQGKTVPRQTTDVTRRTLCSFWAMWN